MLCFVFLQPREPCGTRNRNAGVAMSKQIDDLWHECQSPESKQNFAYLASQWPKTKPEFKCSFRMASGTDIGAYFCSEIGSGTERKIFKVEVGASDREIKAAGTKSPGDILVAIVGRLKKDLPPDIFDDYHTKIEAFFKRFPGARLQNDTYAAPLGKMTREDIDDFIQLHRDLVGQWRQTLGQAPF